MSGTGMGVLIGIIIFTFGILNASIESLTRNVKRNGAKLDMLLELNGINPYDELDDEFLSLLKDLVRSNQKVKAIKHLRERLDIDLKDAKDYIDKLEKEI